jgi:hypothetical protein
VTSDSFAEFVSRVFLPFLKPLGFNLEAVTMSGKQYAANFVARDCSVAVAYEPGDDYLEVAVGPKDPTLSEWDDRDVTPRLQDLNRRYMPHISTGERVANDGYFASIQVKDDLERRLLKAAKELRMTLPRYLAETGPSRPAADPSRDDL